MVWMVKNGKTNDPVKHEKQLKQHGMVPYSKHDMQWNHGSSHLPQGCRSNQPHCRVGFLKKSFIHAVDFVSHVRPICTATHGDTASALHCRCWGRKFSQRVMVDIHSKIQHSDLSIYLPLYLSFYLAIWVFIFYLAGFVSISPFIIIYPSILATLYLHRNLI